MKTTSFFGCAVLCAGSILLTAQQPPVFRAAEDLVAVHVHVLAPDGRPIPGLSADRFEVSIDGRRRRIVTAEFVQLPGASADDPSARRMPGGAMAAGVSASAAATATAARTFIVAVDALSFRVGGTSDVRAAARQFIEALQPDDRVGIYALPTGVGIDATSDRRAVLDALEKIDAAGAGLMAGGGRFQLLPSNLVDVTGTRHREPSVPVRNPPANTALGRIVHQLCASDRDPESCRQFLVAEAEKLALYEEGLALQRIAAVRGILTKLAEQPGAKTVVLISGGVLQTDIPGGRPDLGDLGLLVGKEAARAQTTIYALHVDQQRAALASAAASGRGRPGDDAQRDRTIVGRPLDQMAGASGGNLFTVVQGGGEPFYRRILAETSAHYLLGVEAEDADRGGEPKRLTVRADGLPRGATIRARTWVAIPKIAVEVGKARTPQTQAQRTSPAPSRSSIWDPPAKEDAASPTPPPRRASIWDPPASEEPTAAARPTPASAAPAPAPAPTEFDKLYTAYAGGDTTVVGERLASREDYERHRPDLLRTLLRWRSEWSPRRAAFALEIAMSAIARHWPNPREFVASARAIVTSRPDPPGRNPGDDRFEVLFHRSAAAMLASVDAPQDVDAYFEAMKDRVATDGRPATAARLFDPRLVLARAAAREQLTLRVSSAARTRNDVPAQSWVAAAEDRELRAKLHDVLGLLNEATLSGPADPATQAETFVRQAFVLYRLGRPQDALETLDRQSTDDPVVAAWRELVRGRALTALGRLEEAAAAYQGAERIAPGSQTAAMALATTWMQIGDRAAAEQWAAAARSTRDTADPWTSYWTGDSRFLPALLDELRHSRP